MPHEPARVLQLDLFLSDAQAYRDALTRYETIRPVLREERALAQHSQITGLSYWRLWRDVRRFRRAGVLGLLDRRTLPHPRGRAPVDARLPQSIQQHIVRLAMAHPFTARELAQIVQECYHEPVDYRGIQRVLAPAAALSGHVAAPSPDGAAGVPPALAFNSATHAPLGTQHAGPTVGPRVGT
ncbi:MAG: leucine zipper domain-containing protein [Candidatus Entotheonellia bacterium]